ncbi:NUDIX domain-containing protein [Aridibaculum aurantiacum]|uniref:NUDIX domain-containing protein n=1 Tax=Aridibaculum aurantiacum TaxID=2810307 RepID=UPI001F614EC7|nr:NUDIX domain-containing protein [Aridibaculum aurantiacum]
MNAATPQIFNVRVYGILVENARVLVSDEFIRGAYITKFPGGGLEFGEGTRECLQREFMEETGMEVTVGEHLYTTDFYQRSAFNPAHQIISIYYQVHPVHPITLLTKEKVFDFEPHQVADKRGECEVFRWIPLDNLTEEDLTLPIDKIVVGIVKNKLFE